jgi:hypothetical protein
VPLLPLGSPARRTPLPRALLCPPNPYAALGRRRAFPPRAVVAAALACRLLHARAGVGPGSSLDWDGDIVGLWSISSSAFSFLVRNPQLCFARIDRFPCSTRLLPLNSLWPGEIEPKSYLLGWVLRASDLSCSIRSRIGLQFTIGDECLTLAVNLLELIN